MQRLGRSVADPAITDDSLAERYKWTIYEIEDAPVDKLSEMIVVINTNASEQNKKPPKKGKK